MKIYKQAVLIPKDHSYLEVISYYDQSTGKFGLDIFHEDRLIERIEAIESEPTRDEMRFFGVKLAITEKSPVGNPVGSPVGIRMAGVESKFMKNED
jgi:hypothetical protein